MKPIYRALMKTTLDVISVFGVCSILIVLIIYTQGLIVIGIGIVAIAIIIYNSFLEELEKEKAKETHAQVGMESVSKEDS